MSDIVTIRASSWSDLLDCPHRWEARHLLKVDAPTSGPAALGTALHASTAAFDLSRVTGSGLTVDDTAGVLVDELRRPAKPVHWGEDSPKKAEQIGLRLHSRYCREWSPRYEWRAVEMLTEPLDIEVKGIVIRLTGRMDRARIRKGAKGAGINDLKSGRRAVGRDGAAVTKGHAAQLGVYELLYEHTTGEPITEDAEIIGLQTTGSNPRIGTGTVLGAKARLLGDSAEPGLIEQGASILKSGIFHANPNSRLCSPKFCPRWSTCKFHD